MTTKWPSSCFGAVSRIHLANNNASLVLRTSAITRRHGNIRQYATNPPTQQEKDKADLDRHEKAALVEIKGLRKSDPINSPRSTLPPPLHLPEKTPDLNTAVYYFRIGRAYGSFYWRGIKAVWFNYQASKLLRERIVKKTGTPFPKLGGRRKVEVLSRGEFQLLERNGYDIGKLPFFGLLVCLFGEWLPLLVPFIPGAVPGTCRIPKQIEGMRKKRVERRRRAFRMGVREPEVGEGNEWGMLEKDQVHDLVIRLKDEQLFHLSSVLGLHNRLWDRVQLPPPAVLLRRAITKRLVYITTDDFLLLRDGSGKAQTLNSQEIHTACEERGLDVLGKKEETIRNELALWLERQQEDQGKGGAALTMLFRRLAIRDWVQLNLRANYLSRPNAWDTKKSAAKQT